MKRKKPIFSKSAQCTVSIFMSFERAWFRDSKMVSNSVWHLILLLVLASIWGWSLWNLSGPGLIKLTPANSTLSWNVSKFNTLTQFSVWSSVFYYLWPLLASKCFKLMQHTFLFWKHFLFFTLTLLIILNFK